MCKAFSFIVLENGNVLWGFGKDSHNDIIRANGLKDDTADSCLMTFARCEISPRNEKYLTPDKWEFRIDEQIKPTWFNKAYEQYSWEAWKEWKTKLDSVLVYKPIVHPFRDVAPPKKITKKHLALLTRWASVWASVRDSVWDSVWDSLRDSVWASVRDSVWTSVWDSVRDSVGDSVRDSLRDSVGGSVWDSVGASTGSFFNLPREAWKNTEKIKTGEYPFQSAVDLWMMGLVSSCENKKWRLHGGKDAKVLWEGEIK